MTKTADFIVIGGGAAGASAAAHLAPHGAVAILEAESQPGYHATGRSAALWEPNFGNALVRTLIAGSGDFLRQPPDGFSEHPLLTPRGGLTVADADSTDDLAAIAGERGPNSSLEPLSPDEAVRRVPILRRETIVAAHFDHDVFDMDVNALHRGFLRMAAKSGATLQGDARVGSIARNGKDWQVTAGSETFSAPIVVNAAGAWAEEMGRLAGCKPIGLVPMRRTAVTVDGPADADVQSWPAVDRAGIPNYFKPEAGKLMVSPGDETPSEPQDAQPDELDVAIAIDWFETITTLSVKRVHHSWAGLRSFVADRTPVVGFDDTAEGFFWLAGQGGYGIMLSPVLGRATASLIVDKALPADLLQAGLTPSMIGPARLR
jgi:D-arginine dehydrogenase